MALRYVALAAALAAPTDPSDTDNQPFWSGRPDAPAFERAVDARLARARDLLARLVEVKGRRTVANTLVPYDRLMRELDRAAGATGLIQKVHPDSALREAADRSDRKVSALATEISLDRRVFDAVRAVDLTAADAVTRHYVDRLLRDFRLAGVDRDAPTRERIKALREELETLDAQLTRKEADERRLRGDVGSYQSKVDAAPTRESELVELTRDYTTLQNSYTTLLAKREDSKIAANLERRQIGEQFKVLDPARVPERPFSPNRVRINMIGSTAGLLFGLAVVALLEYRDRSLHTQEEVVRLLQIPVLALVPLMEGPKRNWGRRVVVTAAAAVLILSVCVAGYAAWARYSF